MNNAYTEYFNKSDVTKNYHKKFTNRVDIARHKYEVKILNKHCSGAMFDCTIATGRFIQAFDKVTSYSGMDYAEDFVAHIKSEHPSIDVKRSNLNESIRQNDNSFNTTICLRTLSALGNVEHVLGEMIRITKSGGNIIFDYGLDPTSSSVQGKKIEIDNENIDKILHSIEQNISVVEVYQLDGFLIFLKRLSGKMSRTRFINRIYKHVAIEKLPIKFLLFLEKVNLFSATRKIYILKKN